MPVFVLNASRTFWKLSCSRQPQVDVTLMVAPAAADVLAPGLADVPGLGDVAAGAQAATRSAVRTPNARARADPTMPIPPLILSADYPRLPRCAKPQRARPVTSFSSSSVQSERGGPRARVPACPFAPRPSPKL